MWGPTFYVYCYLVQFTAFNESWLSQNGFQLAGYTSDKKKKTKITTLEAIILMIIFQVGIMKKLPLQREIYFLL